jgi:hypothetical protein
MRRPEFAIRPRTALAAGLLDRPPEYSQRITRFSEYRIGRIARALSGNIDRLRTSASHFVCSQMCSHTRPHRTTPDVTSETKRQTGRYETTPARTARTVWG